MHSEKYHFGKRLGAIPEERSVDSSILDIAKKHLKKIHSGERLGAKLAASLGEILRKTY